MNLASKRNDTATSQRNGEKNGSQDLTGFQYPNRPLRRINITVVVKKEKRETKNEDTSFSKLLFLYNPNTKVK